MIAGVCGCLANSAASVGSNLLIWLNGEGAAIIDHSSYQRTLYFTGSPVLTNFAGRNSILITDTSLTGIYWDSLYSSLVININNGNQTSNLKDFELSTDIYIPDYAAGPNRTLFGVTYGRASFILISKTTWYWAGGGDINFNTVPLLDQWINIKLVRIGANYQLKVNDVNVGASFTQNNTPGLNALGGSDYYHQPLKFYISDFRIRLL